MQGSSSVAVLLSLYVGYCYSQQAHDVYTTLHQRRCDDVVSTLFACWVLCRCVLSLFVLHLYFFSVPREGCFSYLWPFLNNFFYIFQWNNMSQDASKHRTSFLCHDVAATSKRHCYHIVCLLGYAFLCCR